MCFGASVAVASCCWFDVADSARQGAVCCYCCAAAAAASVERLAPAMPGGAKSCLNFCEMYCVRHQGAQHAADTD
jgi:hypothetical protein